jgi:hypothetical protein
MIDVKKLRHYAPAAQRARYDSDLANLDRRGLTS